MLVHESRQIGGRQQEMARVNVNILGISELKWTGMCKFKSDDQYIYNCGQESLRRKEVAITVNKKVQNAVLLSTAKPLQSCPTLCDPIDSSPPGSAVPGILQARIVEWVAISFSNAGK